MSALCHAAGVRLLAYGTIAGGWLSERWLGQPEPDWERTGTWSQMKYGRFIRAAGGWDRYQRVLAAAARVAARHGVSIANVASRWVLEQPAVARRHHRRPAGRAPAHRRHRCASSSFRLSDEDRQELDGARQALTPIAGDCGDEYRTPPFLTASGDLSHHLESFPAPYEVRSGRGPLAVLQRHGVGTAGRLLTRGARRQPRARLGDDGHAPRSGHRRDRSRGASALRHRQDRRLAPLARARGWRTWSARGSTCDARPTGKPVARAHGERFGRIQPANTLVVAELIGDEYLVEMEAEAEIPESRPIRTAFVGGNQGFFAGGCRRLAWRRTRAVTRS